jgi:hypothetical protein
LGGSRDRISTMRSSVRSPAEQVLVWGLSIGAKVDLKKWG